LILLISKEKALSASSILSLEANFVNKQSKVQRMALFAGT
jgi:hypothetical protein